jgi:hypothetical protein
MCAPYRKMEIVLEVRVGEKHEDLHYSSKNRIDKRDHV